MPYDLAKLCPRFYLASRYGRRVEMRGYRDALVGMTYVVTSRWIDTDWDSAPDTEAAHAPAEQREKIALIDFADLAAADVVIAFTEDPGAQRSGRGGRHVEFGIAVALGKRLVVIGPRENVFHYLPVVEHFETWADFWRTL